MASVLHVQNYFFTQAPSVTPFADGEHRALRFFERLWQYDQVVFDVSHADVCLRDYEAAA